MSISLRFNVACNGDDGSAFFARVHQAIEQMNDAGAGCATDCNGVAGEVGVSDSGERRRILHGGRE